MPSLCALVAFHSLTSLHLPSVTALGLGPWDRLNQVPEHEPGEPCPWPFGSMSRDREHEPPPAHASAKAILSHHFDDGASSSDLPCFACLDLALPCLASASLSTIVVVDEPLNSAACRWLGRTWHARTHVAVCVCVVSGVSVMSGMSCHDSLQQSCRLRHLLQRQRPRRRGSLHVLLHGWMRARCCGCHAC